MTSATERIRAMLDERGVEWTVPDESWNQDSITYWKVGGIKWVAFESENDTLWLNCNSVTDLTPAQAIAATLGSCNCTNSERTGTCEADETDLIPFVRADSGDFEVDYIHVMECTECGHVYEHVNGDYEYCPRCGRKRRDVEE